MKDWRAFKYLQFTGKDAIKEAIDESEFLRKKLLTVKKEKED